MKQIFLKSLSVVFAMLVGFNQAEAFSLVEVDGEVSDIKPLQLAGVSMRNSDQGWNQLGYLETRYKERLPLPASLAVKKKIGSQKKMHSKRVS
jgi:hypothetical protein